MADTNGGQDVQGTLRRRQRVGRVMLLVGAALLVVAFFIPWVTLHYVTFTGADDVPVPGVATYSPWVAVWRGVAHSSRLFAGVVLGVFVVFLYDTMRLVARPTRPASRRLARVTAGLAALCVCVVLYLCASVVPGSPLYVLSLIEPFVNATIESGALVGVVAFVVVVVGSVLLAA